MIEKQPSAEAMEAAINELAEFAADGFFDVQEDAVARNERHVLRLALALDAFAAQAPSAPSATALDIVRGIKRAGFAADEERHASEIDAFAARSRWRPLSRWRHKRRGSEYDALTCMAQAQCATGSINEGDRVTVYQAPDGTWWVRKTTEFQDGRFERLPEPPSCP